MLIRPTELLKLNILRRLKASPIKLISPYCYESNKQCHNSCKESVAKKQLLQRPIEPSKVRLGFIPEEWFSCLYHKTGVTGPYMLGVGLLTYLFSKEIYVCEHEFYSGISMAIICVAAVKRLGPPLGKYLDAEIDKIEDEWKQNHLREIAIIEERIADEKKEQWRAEGALMLIEEKKSNIALQLEAAYREALKAIYVEVKNRLDYQVACRNVQERLHAKNMVVWLVGEVEKGLEKMETKKFDEAQLADIKANISAMALRMK